MIEIIMAAIMTGFTACLTCLAFALTLTVALFVFAFIVTACKAFVGLFKYDTIE